MKAVTYDRYGPPEVLQISDIPTPEAGDDEVLIRVHATEVTKADCEFRSFRFAVSWFWLPLRLAAGVFRPRRRVLGTYFAGEVAACGANVTRLSVGDEVYGSAGLRMGAYGQHMVLGENNTVARKPRNMTFEEAAAVPLGGLNALHFMQLAAIRPGEAVLINGAGGSIGLHGIQIAKAFGAEVTAVDKTSKEDLVRRNGADHFIDYTKEDFADVGGKYDIVFDRVPSSAFGACMSVLKANGRYFTGNPRLSVMLRCLWTSKFTDKTASFAFARELVEELDTLTEMIEAGEVRPIVDHAVSMEQIADAHRLVETEARLGAIVLSLDDTP